MEKIFSDGFSLKHLGMAFGVAVIAGVMVSLLDSYVVQRAEAAVGLVPSQA